MDAAHPGERMVLGLDLGSNSLGWALVRETDRNGSFHPQEVIIAGSHAFQAGVEGDILSGRDVSRNTERRINRNRRRQLERRARRKTKLLHLLVRANLLPKGKLGTASERNRYFRELDARLFLYFVEEKPQWLNSGPFARQCFPYNLRACAIKEPLPAEAVGRALYHLAQRRGFLSNRKAKADDDGVVKEAIKNLEGRIKTTLGEYLAGMDLSKERIRGRYTSRDMYKKEFEMIWDTQSPGMPGGRTREMKEEIREAIFYQRPLKSAKGLVGRCSLEQDQRRCPWSRYEAQRFRLLQGVNNLEAVTGQGEVSPLSDSMRRELVEALEHKGDMTFAAVRKLLKMKRDTKFNLERGGEKKLVGNRLVSGLFKIFGQSWNELTTLQQRHVIEDVVSYEKENALARRGREEWGLNQEAAGQLAQMDVEEGYCALSAKAIRKLLPLLEEGTPYGEARPKLYPDMEDGSFSALLGPVNEELPGITNHVVSRALTEMRKVVNAVVRSHGKPDLIRLEMAREMKKSRKRRQADVRKTRDREKARVAAAKTILERCGHIKNVTRRDILKYELAEECSWTCPYTGEHFGWDELFGPAPTVDVEHIVPLGRSLDDSYMNKTLSMAQENRNVKGNRTPWEAYGGTEKYRAILERVEKFKCDLWMKQNKLKLFQLEDVQAHFEDFVARQLADTSYAARLARPYLGTLYPSTTKHVQVVSGSITAMARGLWGLSGMLGGRDKNRDDHRHHALDALAVALTGPDMVQKLTRSALLAQEKGSSRNFERMEEPWPGFRDDAKRLLSDVVTSFAVHRKVNGRLHKETHYGSVNRDGERRATVRKKLCDMSRAEAGRIVDPLVRRLVAEALEKSGGKEPSKVFQEEGNLPVVRGGRGAPVVVRKAVVQVQATAVEVGRGMGRRHVEQGANHHLAIFEAQRPKGVAWEGEVVSRFEAMSRLRRDEPVVNREHACGGRFLFTLHPGDMIEIDGETGREVCRVRSVSKKATGSIAVEFVRANDARRKVDIRAAKQWFDRSPESLRKLNCRKVIVTPLGEIRKAND